MDRFKMFKEACKFMDEDKYYEAYMIFDEMKDYCLEKSVEQANKRMNEILEPIGLSIGEYAGSDVCSGE